MITSSGVPAVNADWLLSHLSASPEVQRSNEFFLRLTITLANEGVPRNSGPFASLVVDDTKNILAAAVNRVQENNDSTAHAEVEALRLAEGVLQNHNLSGCTLYTSSSPCVMCYGAIYWSGVDAVYSACGTEYAEEIGFDEGPVNTALWKIAQEKKGICYTRAEGEIAEAAREPFLLFQKKGGSIY